MKAVVWTDIDKLETKDVPLPEPKENEAIIKVGCTSICGSDLAIISGKHPRAQKPLVFGHEFMGTVFSSIKRLPLGFSIGQWWFRRVRTSPN